MFVIKKSNIVIICVLIITAITFAICFNALGKKSALSAENKNITIVLDAGHGGIDGGVTGVNSGVKESELNLKVVKKIEQYLIDAGINVVLTRSTDAGLYGVATKNLKKRDMEKRKNIILEANPILVVSVHMNKYSISTRRGAQVFFKPNDENSKKLAENIQASFNDMEQAVRKCNALSGDYYILNCTKIPSVIAECGFLSNPQDEALLITDEYQKEIAYAVFKGIVGYLSQSSINYYGQ